MCETFMIQRTAVIGMNMIVRAETAVLLCFECTIYIMWGIRYIIT